MELTGTTAKVSLRQASEPNEVGTKRARLKKKFFLQPIIMSIISNEPIYPKPQNQTGNSKRLKKKKNIRILLLQFDI